MQCVCVCVFLQGYGCFYFFYSCLAFVIQHVIKIMHSKVTHTLMESCCVEEFLPSAAIEGIWGFTRAIAMVGGV